MRRKQKPSVVAFALTIGTVLFVIIPSIPSLANTPPELRRKQKPSVVAFALTIGTILFVIIPSIPSLANTPPEPGSPPGDRRGKGRRSSRSTRPRRGIATARSPSINGHSTMVEPPSF